MKYDPNIHKRKSIRLQYFDYSTSGAYFVTMCIKNMECVLGNIVHGETVLSCVGEIVYKYWNELPIYFDNVSLDEYVFMPNHMHGIVIIENEYGDHNRCKGGVTPPQRTTPQRKPTLGQIVAYFKYQSTKTINKIHNTPCKPFWQRNYYEHIIRNDTDLNRIRKYIINNPSKWQS